MSHFRKISKVAAVTLLCFVVFSGCSTTQNISVLSFGNLEGKKIPDSLDKIAGAPATGQHCGFAYSLARAAANALAQSPQYDTILNAEVTHSTSILVAFNCISIKGFALNSASLKDEKKK